MGKPELLSPAGSLKHLHYAFAYGADAIYAGQPRYSLRVRNNSFTTEAIETGIQIAHRKGKKFYLVVNLVPHNAKLNTFLEDLAPIAAMSPDGVIVSDPGLIYLLKRHFPSLPLHLSVQANTMNWASVQFWKDLGVVRVILSRELALEEIAEIRQIVPDIELEVFVHGALCMAHSGRCLLSSYLHRRDANQGACVNACRQPYLVIPARENDSGEWASDLRPDQSVGSALRVFEDEGGTYFMNSKDLCAINQVPRLCAAGVHSLKIEGRTKSAYYVARTAHIYRHAIDYASKGEMLPESVYKALGSLVTRGYTEGFLNRHRSHSDQNYQYGHSRMQNGQFVGEFSGVLHGELGEVIVKNRFAIGDQLSVLTPEKEYFFELNRLVGSDGRLREVAPGDGYRMWIPLPDGVSPSYALLVRWTGSSKACSQT